MFFINSVNCNSTAQSQATNPCDTGNGGCQHLCILSRSSESSYRCFCNVGYELAADGKSCIPPNKFIMFTQYGYVRGINWREDMKQYIEVFDRLKPSYTFCSNFDVDTKKGVFYQPSELGNLQRVDLHSGKHKSLLPELRATVAAFDWVTKNLYYINQYIQFEEDTFLRVLNTKNATYSKILGKGKWSKSGLAVHPNRGYVYYQETITNVRRVFTDGSNSTLLLEKSKQISCITIDYIEDKLYWVETETNTEDFRKVDVIFCSNLDGMNIVKVEAHFLHNPTMMRIQGDWIYIINNYKESLNRVPKKGGQLEPLITSLYTCGLQIFDPSIQTIRSNHPCASDENPCDKFCFAVPLTERDEGLQRVCGCPYSEKLADDGRTCINNSKEELPIVPVKA